MQDEDTYSFWHHEQWGKKEEKNDPRLNASEQLQQATFKSRLKLYNIVCAHLLFENDAIKNKYSEGSVILSFFQRGDAKIHPEFSKQISASVHSLVIPQTLNIWKSWWGHKTGPQILVNIWRCSNIVKYYEFHRSKCIDR